MDSSKSKPAFTRSPHALLDALWELATTIDGEGKLCWCPLSKDFTPVSEHTGRCLAARANLYPTLPLRCELCGGEEVYDGFEPNTESQHQAPQFRYICAQCKTLSFEYDKF